MAKSIPFPIKTDTACLLKWNWSTIWLNTGVTSSCHRNFKVPFGLEEFDNFHNLEYKIRHRESMLAGERPHSPEHLGCGYCWNIEDAGGTSDRQYMTQSQTDQTPDELVEDPTATRVTPAVLEVFVNNVCNLACSYCSVRESSRLLADAIRFDNPGFDSVYYGNGIELLSHDLQKQYHQHMISWLRRHGQGLRRLHLLGGEPFFQPEFEDYVSVWRNNPNPNLVFNVISNFNVKPARFRRHVDQVLDLVRQGHINRFDLTASIDCWGEEQEYVRRGFKCDITEENMQYVLQFPEIKLHIHSVHSVLSLGNYVDLLKKKQEWQKVSGHKISLFGQKVSVTNDYCDPCMFGNDYWQETFNQIRKSHPLSSFDDQQNFDTINGIMKQIEKGPSQPGMMKHFLTVYNELDRRHGTNWRSVYPKVAKEIDRHIIL